MLAANLIKNIIWSTPNLRRCFSLAGLGFINCPTYPLPSLPARPSHCTLTHAMVRPHEDDVQERVAKRPKLLPLMRHNGAFYDGTVVVEDEEMKVHRDVVCNASPFFANAFKGRFAEAAAARVEVKEASAKAMSIILDYIYGEDVFAGEREHKLDTVLEVLELAKRFLVGGLASAAAQHIVHGCSDADLVRIFGALKPWMHDEVEDAFLARVGRAFGPPFIGANFSYDFLRRLYTSPELVADDEAMLRTVSRWAQLQDKPDMEQVEALLEYVDFQRIPPTELAEILELIANLPPRVWARAVDCQRPVRYEKGDFPIIGSHYVALSRGSHRLQSFLLPWKDDLMEYFGDEEEVEDTIRTYGVIMKDSVALRIRFYVYDNTVCMGARVDRRVASSEKPPKSVRDELEDRYIICALRITSDDAETIFAGSQLKKCSELLFDKSKNEGEDGDKNAAKSEDALMIKMDKDEFFTDGVLHERMAWQLLIAVGKMKDMPAREMDLF